MKRVTLLIIPMLLALGLVVAGWRAWDQTSAPPILLSDGSWIEFCTVTVGSNSTYRFGTVWQRLLARIPGKLGQKYGGKYIVSAGYDSPTNVIFWLVRRGATNWANQLNAAASEDPLPAYQLPKLTRPGSFTPYSSGTPSGGIRVNVKDDQGEGEPGFENFRQARLPNGDLAMFWSAKAVPRHSPALKLCLYGARGGAGGRRLGE